MWVMTLPADVALAVHGHIDARNFPGARGVLRVTTAAQFPRLRFARQKFARIHLVLLGRFMAARARNVEVMRKRFGARDGGMAGFALFRRLRRLGIVRMVARDARLERIMRGRDNLRKSGGPRRQEFVAQRTTAPFSRRRKLHAGVLRVADSRAVTDLAGHGFVISGAFGGHDIRVAVGAGDLTGVLNRLRHEGINRRGAEVAILSEIARDKYDQRFALASFSGACFRERA